MLVHHRWIPIYRDNMLSPDIAAMVVGIIMGYNIDVAKSIAR